MRSTTRSGSWWRATVVWSCLLVPASAEEPVQQFLDALRERRYHTEALNYLEEMRTSPVAPASFRAIIEFERAKTLIAAAGAARDRGRREALLDEAQSALETFSREQPAHPLTPEATERFADLLIRRSEMALQRARDEATPAGQRTELLERSRSQLGQAEEILSGVREDLKTRLQRIDPKTTDPQLKAMLDDYRVRYMQVRLNLAQLKLSRGDTYDQQSEERRAVAAAAEAEFTEIRKAYRSFGGTFVLSTVGLAQSLQTLERYDEALVLADEVLELPAGPELREIQRRALDVAIDALRRRDPVPYEEMIRRAEPVVGVLRGDEAEALEWAKLHLDLATFYHESAMVLEAAETKTAEDRQKIDGYRNRAEEIAKGLTRGRSPLKSEAQRLLASWGSGRAAPTADVSEPVNFLQAQERAVAVLTDLDNAKVVISTLQSEIANATEPGARAELQRRLSEAEQTIRTAPLEAMRWLERAVSLADAETTPEDLSVTRRLMAYVHELEGRYYHAGVIGERQLAEMPNTAGARAAGKIALNAYWALYQQAPPDAREFEIDHLRSVGEALLKHYPNSDEATRAANFLALVSLAKRDLVAAEGYLDQIPEAAPERTRLLAAIGSARWWEYLRQVSAIDAARRAEEIDAEEAQRRREALVPLREEARTKLESGLARLNLAGVDQAMATASLAAAQLALSENRASDALAVLERAEVGPLSLLKDKHPAVADARLANEIYRTALRAYIGSAAVATDVSSQIQRARGVMTALESSVGTTEEGRASLVSLYVALVSELRQQIEAISDSSQRTAFAAGVSSFLEEVQQTATDPNLLVWTAETMAGVAEALSSAGDEAQAKVLYEKAEATLRRSIAGGESNSKQRAEIQLAGILRAQGRYQEAIELYATVLSAKPNLVSVQVEAAHTYHRWGRAARSAERLSEAMAGGAPRPNPQTGRTENAIWGWGKLAQSTVRTPQFRDIFFEARYQLAYARLEYAVLTKSDEQLSRVERDVRGTLQVDPELGGAVWRGKFDALVKALQKQRGEPTTGLAGLSKEP